MTLLRWITALAAIALLALLGGQSTAAAVGNGASSSSADAAALLGRARQARGSAAAWRRLRNVVLDQSLKYVASSDLSQATYIFAPPDRFQWINGSHVHTIDRSGYRQNRDVPATILESARARVFRTFTHLEIVYLLQWPSTLPLRLQRLPRRDFRGKKVDVLRFAGPDDVRLDLLLDADRGLPIGYVAQSDISGQPTESSCWLTDYRDVEGIAFPFRKEGQIGDYKYVEVLSRVRVNVTSPFTAPSRP